MRTKMRTHWNFRETGPSAVDCKPGAVDCKLSMVSRFRTLLQLIARLLPPKAMCGRLGRAKAFRWQVSFHDV